MSRQFTTEAEKALNKAAKFAIRMGQRIVGSEHLLFGLSAAPGVAAKVLKENGMDPASDVTIEWKSEHSECVAALANDPSGIAMLPQPFVTTAQKKNPAIRVALDLTEEWDKTQENKEEKSALLTGVVVARTEFVKKHPEAVSDFLERYASSVDFVNADTDQAAKLVGQYEIVTEEVAKKALPECNIVCVTGEEMQKQLSGYLKVLYDANAESIGGSLPEDEFYYSE